MVLVTISAPYWCSGRNEKSLGCPSRVLTMVYTSFPCASSSRVLAMV